MDRYAGKPFLRLLDSYFLDVIGQLSEEQDEALVAMQPRLAQVYGDEGSWQDMVAAQMQFPPRLDEQVRRFWAGYLEHCKANGMPADPNEFVVSFIDQNFPGIE